MIYGGNHMKSLSEVIADFYIEKNIIGLDDMEHDNDIHAPIKEYTRGHYFKGIE